MVFGRIYPDQSYVSHTCTRRRAALQETGSAPASKYLMETAELHVSKNLLTNKMPRTAIRSKITEHLPGSATMSGSQTMNESQRHSILLAVDDSETVSSLHTDELASAVTGTYESG